MAGRIFISHASENADVADRIVTYLEGKGAPCWISSRDISPKEIYAEAITQAMREAQSCIVIVSAAANGSAAVKRELELASRYSKPFIPIRIDATEPGPGLDYYLNNTQWVDYGRERERALDRVIAAYASRTGASTSAARAAPAPKSGGAKLVALLSVGAILLAGGVWFALTQMRAPQTPPALTQADMEAAGASLVGSYRWEGIACGEGPAVVLSEDLRSFYFDMPGTPTYRHEVLSLARDASGNGVRIQTRVTQPAEHAGKHYMFRVPGRNSALEVTANGSTDEWERCAEGAAGAQPGSPPGADAAPPAAAPMSVAGTTWYGVWGEASASINFRLASDGRACVSYSAEEVCDWRWEQEGANLTIRSQGETWSGRIEGDVFSGELRQGHGEELQAIATPQPFRLERNPH